MDSELFPGWRYRTCSKGEGGGVQMTNDGGAYS